MGIVKRIKLLLLSLLAVVCLLVIALLLFERLQQFLADRSYPRPGRLIDVGGHGLHAVVTGQGSPSVIFESGLGIDGHLSWYKVQGPVAEFAQTVSYDRAGVFWSERGDNPKTAETISMELARLLANGGIDPPYVLVGHSLAGITLRPFIAEHLDDIVGIVFVDVSHPDQLNRYPEEMRANTNSAPPPFLMQLMRSLGYIRYRVTSGPRPTEDLDDAYATVVPTMIHRSLGVQQEGANLESMANEVAHITDFGSVPLVVITGANPSRYESIPYSKAVREELEDTWHTMQDELLELSSNSRRILATGSDHYVQISEPEIVIDAIRSIVEPHAE